MNNEIMKMGAIVSKRVAIGESSILCAIRSEPVDEADSGWEFSEGSSFEKSNSENPQLWLVSEVLELEPSLTSFINLAAGTRIVRKSNNDSWTLSRTT